MSEDYDTVTVPREAWDAAVGIARIAREYRLLTRAEAAELNINLILEVNDECAASSDTSD